MNLEDFMSLVQRMRDAQTEYFRTRDRNVLQRSKALEREVDEAIRTATQMGLFQ
ncbi:MAG: hypothetical protein AAFY29_22920 [Pseudomonadota bacterium]